jgi:hypothetical protein
MVFEMADVFLGVADRVVSCHNLVTSTIQTDSSL